MSPETADGVYVELPSLGFSMTRSQGLHPAGTHWRITKRGRLVVLDASGSEVARYKENQWSVVFRQVRREP